ncbi:MAG: DUF3299 domain-containing protein [Pseudomonadota bacterium]
MRTLSCLALLLLFSAACTGSEAESDDRGTVTSGQSRTAVDRSEREIGPRPARPIRQADDNSLAARAEREAARKAELAARGVRELGWEELLPEGEEERLAELYMQQMALLYGSSPIAEGSAADVAVQIGTFNTVPELNGVKVRIPGYTVPFDFSVDAQIREFLLVPYFGACLHAPPPPPNQTLYIKTDDPIQIRDLAQAVWIEGTLLTQTQESDLADAAYTIQMDRIETYTY